MSTTNVLFIYVLRHFGDALVGVEFISADYEVIL